MMKSLIAKNSLNPFNLVVLCLAVACGNAQAAPSKMPAKDDHKVEFKGALPVTQEEIAAVNVLGEICPKLLGNTSRFTAGYARLLAEMLPTIQQPVLALNALQDDAEYQKILNQARQDANQVTVKENREVCQEIANYPGNSAPANKTKK